jgi:RNA polymerase sigma factor (sigma-70 family)
MGVLAETVAEIRRARESAATVTLEDPAARALSDNSIALEDRAVVDAAFRTLSVLERRIIVGTYVLRLSSLELGRTLGLPPRRISRIRRSALGRIQAVWVS